MYVYSRYTGYKVVAIMHYESADYSDLKCIIVLRHTLLEITNLYTTHVAQSVAKEKIYYIINFK